MESGQVKIRLEQEKEKKKRHPKGVIAKKKNWSCVEMKESALTVS